MFIMNFKPMKNYIKNIIIGLIIGSFAMVANGQTKTTVVGSQPSNYSVNETGGFTYSLPIEVPPGINGLQPNFALTYNSQSGNGLLGYGWSLSGLGSITRTGENHFLDHRKTGVDFNGDKYMLNGQRLIVVKGNYGADLSEYRTEIASYQKIVAHKSFAFGGYDGPSKFTVYDNQGLKHFYGRTQNSRFFVQDNIPGNSNFSTVMMWLKSSTEDRMGNKILYVYKQIKEKGEVVEVVLERVEVRNKDEDILYSVKFEYGDKIKTEKYIHGNKIVSSKKLKEIRIVDNGITYRKYEINYANVNGIHDTITIKNMYVKSVSCYGDKYEKLKDITFERANVPNSNLIKGQIKLPKSVKLNIYGYISDYYYTNDFSYGDFNADGYTDIIAVYGKDEKDDKRYVSVIFLNDKHGGFYRAGHGNSWVSNNKGTSAYNKIVSYLITDFNNDGIKDFIRVLFVDRSGKKDDKYVLTSFQNTGLGHSFSLVKESEVPMDDNNGLDYQLGDFNGDSKMELIRFGKVSSPPYIEIKTYDLPSFKETTTFSFPLYSDNMFMRINDFNADGKSDVLIFHDGGVFVFTKPNNSNNTFNLIYLDGYPTRHHRVFTGDFNGDGRVDVLTWNSNTHWELKYNVGAGIWAENNQNPICWKNGVPPTSNDYGDPGLENKEYFCYVIDMNRDGMSDIVEIFKPKKSSITEMRANIHISTGVGFNSYLHKKIREDANIVEAIDYGSNKFLDINGDGQEDIIINHKKVGDTTKSIYYFRKNDMSKHINKIITEYQDTISIQYNYLTKQAHYEYKQPTNEAGHILSGYIGFSAPLLVTDKIKYRINGKEYNNQYKFYEGVVHPKGRGFLGFKKKTVNSSLDLTLTETRYSLKNQAYALLLPQSESVMKLDHLIQYSAFSYILQNNCYYTNWRHKNILLDSKYSSQYDYETGALLSKQCVKNYYKYWYKKYGQIEKSVVHKGKSSNINNNYITKETTSYQYHPIDEANWVINVPKQVKNIKVLKGSSQTIEQTTKTEIYPKGHQHYPLPKNVYLNKEDNLGIKKHFEYDDYGNVILKQVSAPNSSQIPQRETQYEYNDDYNHRFLTKTTVKNGNHNLVTTTQYNKPYGNPSQTTDANGLTTKYEYDGFNRLTKTQYPDKTKTTVEREWVSSKDTDVPTHVAAIYKTIEETDGEEYVKSYYDQKGQVIRTVSEQQGGIVYGSHNVQKIRYEYDEMNRIKEEVHPGLENNPTLYKYDKLTTTVSGPGVYKKTTTNALGWPIEVKDQENVIHYTYYADGKPKTIKTNKGEATISLTYDKNGNRTRLEDPSAGTILSEYDAFGQMVWQEDYKGNRTEYLYDRLGRVIVETNQYHTIRSKYDTKKLGLLTSVASSKHKLEYDYDNLLRVKKETETISGMAPVKVMYEYDNLSRVKIKNYNNLIKLKYHYDSNTGELNQVSRVSLSGSKMLWQALARDEYGALTQYEYGNNVITTLQYYSKTHFPASIKDNKNILNLVYSWDDNHNLTSKSDKKLQRHFYYQYDALNRLTREKVKRALPSVVPGGPPVDPVLYDQQLSYAPNGNIISNNQLGNYTYNTPLGNGKNPYAVSKITAVNDDITDSYKQKQDIDYNALDKTAVITQGDQHIYFEYGVGEQRIRQVKTGSPQQTYYYGHGISLVQKGKYNEWRIYLNGGNGAFAVYKKKQHESTGNLYYLHRDYQGSILALSNEQGNTVEQLRYTAWGIRVNPYTCKPLDPNTTHILDRGYTMHEHLDGFDLINMNGRIYDPVLCRFLSPDNYVQNTTDPQNFNKYSYVLNNPLKYTDPSGEITWWDVGAGAMIAGGIVLTALGQPQFGGSLIGSGFTHFAYAHSEMKKNPGMSWNEASDKVGLTYTQVFNFGGPKPEPTPNDDFLAEKSYDDIVNNNINSSGEKLTVNSLRPRSGYGMSLHESIDYYSYQSEQIDGGLGGGVYYPIDSYSYDKIHIQYLPAEGIGLLGGWSRVRGNAKVYLDSDGKYYADVSATGYTPASIKGAVNFSGSVDVLSGNKVISSHPLHAFLGPSVIQSGRYNVGNAVFALPNVYDDVYLRFNIGYSYSEGVGAVVPMPRQGHYKIQIGFLIDAWTH